MASSQPEEHIRVLLVDDEPALLDLTKTFLEQASDINATTVESGAGALDVLEAQPFDAVVSDYQMPGMDGIELLKRIRERGLTVPFILFTGKGREEVVIEALNSGASLYLQKGGDPVSMYTMLDHNVRSLVRERKFQDGLRVSELKFKKVFDASFVALSLTDEEGRIVEWNRRAEELTGLSAEEVMGRFEWDALAEIAVPENRSPERLERQRQRYREALEKGLPASQQGNVFDGSLMRKNGITVHFSQQIFSIPTPKGFLLYTVVWETTNYRQAEEALRKSLAVLARSQEVAKLGSWSLDLEAGVFESSDEAPRIFGLEAGTTPSLEQVVSMVHPDDQEEFWRFIDTMRLDGRPKEIDFRIVRSDGSLHYVHGAACDFVRGADSAVKLASGIVQDITERRKAEEALRKSEEGFRSMFDNAADAIILHHRDGTIIAVNQKAVDRFGYTKEEFLKMTPWDLDLPEQHRKQGDHIETIKRTGSVRFEAAQQTKDGRRTISEISARLLAIDGKPTILSIIRDISERKRMEEGLKRAYDQINLLSQITRHDIKNQLLIGKGFLSMMEEGCGDEKTRKRMDKLRMAFDNIERQIDFTKIYQDLGSVPPSWHNVLDIIAAIPNKHSVPHIELGKGLKNLEVYADPMIEKVFYNLIENTVRYGGKPPRVRIDAIARERCLSIVYEDAGPGIPTHEKERIFEKGFGKGTGLGLFLSRDILSLTGIEIKETGEPGTGARFEICVPIDKHRYAMV